MLYVPALGSRVSLVVVCHICLFMVASLYVRLRVYPFLMFHFFNKLGSFVAELIIDFPRLKAVG